MHTGTWTTAKYRYR